MEKRLKEYIKYMEAITQEACSGLSSDRNDEAIRDLLIQIGFFQHERLVHLIVTVIFALLTMMTLLGCLLVENMGMYLMLLLFVVLLIPYIRHYYILENGVQKLYTFYDVLTCDK